ncbi:MAG: HRDC domain-containing protein [Pontiellaceae bacterium]|nr:HRDC domain-containing protein [Pontiellaceae bacterium]
MKYRIFTYPIPCDDEEGVPVYTIFTNAQLAEIVKKGVDSLSGLEQVEGVGKSRVEKCGEALLGVLRDFSGAAALECGGSTPL